MLLISQFSWAQEVPILNYSIGSLGQVQLEIAAQADQYYVLRAQHEPGTSYESATSITMGVDGNLTISEPLGAYPQANYVITAYDIATPSDTDGDGLDDMAELNNMPTQGPLNYAEEVLFVNGTVSLSSHADYSSLAVVDDNVPWAPFLNDQEFVKFVIVAQDSDQPRVYFVNSETHGIHASFIGTINTNGDEVVTGEIVYNPNTILPNGTTGSYSFNYSFGNAYPFDHTRRTYELLAANMPYLQNNLRHFIGSGSEATYETQYQADYAGSRLSVILESQVFADVDFLPFNQAEGYGFFRQMTLDENPGSRDIVLYDALPNSLPRVGGIITSIIQTPLSHVNLRAIQDGVPNAYINNPLDIDSIVNLLDSYIYYKVEAERYIIREATLDEVNAWYENLRPTEPQIPERDLSQTSILPLDEIGFPMATAFGAKCANVATMRSFGFPEGTIPNGFGVPFYFYDEFMKFNNFYERVETMLANPDFINDLETRIDMLKDFRRDIKDAGMPVWMLEELDAMHDSFPEGTSVRCRSSTNNEDLPGFSGAGLYTSKTQHPDEGHISKSIKQVYASMWNFRAYDERDFYRVDQYIAAMGVLCHPNYEDEKSNGVGVSLDPIYDTENTFYLNTQVGESLITNPEANAVPEEILLNRDPSEGFTILRESNLTPLGQLVMDVEYLNQLRDYLSVIHDEFAELYNVVGAEGFGMDIEYKVTSEDQLIIKQARPWVSFWADIKATYDLAATELVAPQNSASLGSAELLTVNVANRGLKDMADFDISLSVAGQAVETLNISDNTNPQTDANYQFTVPQDFSAIGDYEIEIIVSHAMDGYADNDTLRTLISKVHLLEGGIEIKDLSEKCGDEVAVVATISNYGETTFNNTEIEVVVNGLVVDVINYSSNIPYLGEAVLAFSVTDNLQAADNEVTLNLLKVNGLADAVPTNNTATAIATAGNAQDDKITFIINTDDFPQENSWKLYDQTKGELVGSGILGFQDEGAVLIDLCVDYNSCFSLSFFDSFGDGICCAYGDGNFLVLNSSGDTLVINDGEFSNLAEELFCPNAAGCAFSAEVFTTNTSAEGLSDGTITISPTSGPNPYVYSVDGGATFYETSTFENLAPGTYDILVSEASGTCSYEETITIDVSIVNDIEDTSLGQIRLFPNPTSDQFTIALPATMPTSSPLQIGVYDQLGRCLAQQRVPILGGEQEVPVSLATYPPGSYIVKCAQASFTATFSVVKVE